MAINVPALQGAFRLMIAKVGGPEAYLKMLEKENQTLDEAMIELANMAPKDKVPPEDAAYCTSKEFKDWVAGILGLM